MSAQLVEIESVLAAYTAYSDAGRPRDMADLFTSSGVLRVAGVPHVGPDEIVAFAEHMGRQMIAAGGLLPGAHHVSSRHVELDGSSSASSSSVFLFVSPSGPDHWGSYRDRLEQGDRGWRIAERSVRFSGFRDGSPARAVVGRLRDQTSAD